MPQALVAALATQGVTSPFPIQTATLPDALAGRDVLGRGRTGSGKTYAFVVPLLARLAASGTRRRPGRPRALILAPTRELATQIEASLAPLAEALSMRVLTVFGGVGARPQINALSRGVDVLVACPGRLDDHVRSGHASLDSVEVTVLDEADHMADLGFLPVVRKLLDQTPEDGQRLLFSATLDAAVDVLVRRYLYKPVTHSVDPPQSPVSTMSHHMLHVRADDRFPVLVDLTAAPGRSLVFTRTKRGAKVLAKKLVAAGVPAVELHGNLAQNARTRNMSDFAEGRVRTLVATDIAARGIHVDDVTLVIHADPPAEHKAYLHRSGRTARAGASGTVVTLMTDAQLADVADLARRAGIRPTTTRLRVGDPLLAQLAPGQRSFVQPEAAPADRAVSGTGRGTGRGRGAAPARANGGRASAADRSPDAGRSADTRRGTPAGRGGSTGRSVDGRAGSEAHAPRASRSRRGGRGRSGTSTPAAAPAQRSGGDRASASSGGAAAFSSRSRAGRRSR
ncbi:RNA helicase [Virgisporangium ochraceum]|uniref:RNA helicase n=1 Tax=Virgisporangium ochraceum TaxID=65505 RepID=A0A8J3ZU63_9ACTN|nr:RNA helicase [Virgisporangium ochraceum]